MNLRPCAINGIEFDALISETRTHNSDVPEYGVESGYEVSDNISIKPMTVEITGYLTNTPVTWLNSHGTGRVEAVADQLENLYFSRQLVTLATRTNIYPNMSITAFSVVKDQNNKTSREIRMSLKQVTVVSAQKTSIPSSYIRGGDSGVNAGTAGTGGSHKGGSSSGSGSSGKTESESQASILYNLFN